MKKSNHIIKSIFSSGGKDIILDTAEITLDAVTNSDIVDKIPVVGWIRKLFSIGHSINDSYFILKLLKFLKELQTVSEAEKAEFKSRMKADAKLEAKVGDKLIELLIRMDDVGKAKIVARLFAAFIDGKIGDDSFCRYSQVVNNSYLNDLVRIGKSAEIVDEDGFVEVPVSDAMVLLNSGLVNIKSKSMPAKFSGVGGALVANNIIEYSLNDSGLEFFGIIKD
jgi:hypothetical protein